MNNEQRRETTATWIWYPGDFEVWLGNRFNNRRTERGAMFPPFWKQDSHYVTVEFSKAICAENAEFIEIFAEGSYNVMLDGKLLFGRPSQLQIPAGEHRLNIKVWNQASPPALFVKGPTIVSDDTWLATYEDKIWIDENGVAHGSGIYVHAASWNFNSFDTPPSTYALLRQPLLPVSTERIGENAILYDFGRETFGYLCFQNLDGEGVLNIFYGESREEALDKEHCETLDCIGRKNGKMYDFSQGVTAQNTSLHDLETNYQLANSKAFRFVYVETEGNLTFEALSMEFEYAPQDLANSGTFRCNDDEINEIWQVSAYTLDLTTREFFVDGIKRDRWTWSGDAIQSYLMNYYLRFDSDCVRRTIRQLRGKDPVTAHVNTIMDYSFYWFKSVYDFYLYTGDIAFLREIYPRMVSLMNYCVGRTNELGMAEGQPDDWIFVDWTDFPMHKRGALCFEQILYCKALETMALCAKALRDYPDNVPPQGSLPTQRYAEDASKYDEMAKNLLLTFKKIFWNEESQAFGHAIEDGQQNTTVTRFPNMFAIIYGYADEKERKSICENVLFNDFIDKITTPYMRFYELEAICMMGGQSTVLQEIKTYWGGMLKAGATTFWEKYNPADTGVEHYAMYGRPYGKSLCHAWGASPIYLLGKYFLGVQPTSPGYETFTVSPVLGTLEWMEGDVPTPFGKIHVEMDQKSVRVKSDGGHGMLHFAGKTVEIPPRQLVEVNL